jgi:hypothetical protein
MITIYKNSGTQSKEPPQDSWGGRRSWNIELKHRKPIQRNHSRQFPKSMQWNRHLLDIK